MAPVRRSANVVFALACAGWLQGLAVRAEPGPHEPSAEEPAAAAARLASENRALRAQLAELDRDVRRLTRMLAEAKAEQDLLRTRADGSGPRNPVETGRGIAGGREEMRVIAVDREHGVLAVAGGAEQNLRVGMTAVIVRNNRVMATVRLDDVRARVSGALVEKRPGGGFPEVGDRLVLATTEER